VLVGPAEWERGCVRVKDQATREERDVAVDDLVAEAEAERGGA
jgi:histidyl-tRNA synthetase